MNENVIAEYYAENPDLLRYFRPASYWPKGLEAARKMGLEKYFPTIPDIQKLNYLKYERFLEKQDGFFDTNSVIQAFDPYEIFIPGFRTEDHVYPDHCHLNGRGWEIVARSLSSRIADLFDEQVL